MINTYPEMNETIKNLLRMSDEPFKQYILQRIIELEEQVDKKQQEVKKLKENLANANETIDIMEHTWTPLDN